MVLSRPSSSIDSHLLQQILPHPMQLAWMAFQFPYADLKSTFSPSKDKKAYFFTYTGPISYTTSVYAGFSTTTYVLSLQETL